MLLIYVVAYQPAYSNVQKISPSKAENFQIKNSDIFHISAQNIDCGYLLELPQRGSSNEYPQSMFLSRNKKKNVYPCKPQFYCIKVGFMGVKITKACFCDGMTKPTIRPVWPSKIQISLYIWVLFYPSFDRPEAVEGTCNQQRLRSDCTDAQAESESSLVAQVLL